MKWEDFEKKINLLIYSCIKNKSKEDAIKFLRNQLSNTSDKDVITYVNNDVEYKITKEEFDKLNYELNNYKSTKFSLFSDNCYEVVIEDSGKQVRSFYRMWLYSKMNSIDITDRGKKINYKIQDMSDLMLFNFLINIDFKDLKKIFITIPNVNDDDNQSMLTLFRYSFKSIRSIYLTYEDIFDIQYLDELIDSFLFNICYNCGISFRVISSIVDIMRTDYSFIRPRTLNLSHITAPNLVYNKVLTEQYRMAVSSIDPFVQFIGYYHIMEYFFEEVYKEDVLDHVRKQLNHPGFSVKRNKDIMKIVNLINKKKAESLVGTELESLELTLTRYIDIDEIAEKLNKIDKKLIDYYKNNKVEFSNGDEIDLQENGKNIFKKLANRIYKTRNSLVHSKSNDVVVKDRGMYEPFKDVNVLSKEIPLLKSIAEEIIIASAKEL